MMISDNGIRLIKEHEGFRSHAYPDPGSGGDPWTVGYGSTHDVHPGTVVTEREAEAMLIADIHVYEAAVNHGVRVPISQGQFDALVSLCYNIGVRHFLGSTVLKRLNASDFQGAADAFLMWDKAAHHVMAGLHKRREDERRVFMGDA